MSWWHLIALRIPLLWKTRLEATRALGKCKTRRAARLLVARLADGHPTVRLVATGALAELGRNSPEILAASLHDDSWQVRMAAADALVRACWKPGNEAERAALAVARGRYSEAAEMGTAALDPLLWDLKHGHWLSQEQVALALGRIGDSRAVGALLEALGHGTIAVQIQAALALGNIGDHEAAEPLLETVARAHAYHDVRMAAAEALVRLGDVRVVPWLVQLAEEGEVALPAVVELKRILTDRLGDIPPEHLRAVASMPDTAQVKLERDDYGEKVRYRHEIDCSEFRKLAMDELSRRGCEPL